MAGITKLPGWGLVDGIWVDAVTAITSVNMESTEGRGDSRAK